MKPQSILLSAICLCVASAAHAQEGHAIEPKGIDVVGEIHGDKTPAEKGDHGGKAGEGKDKTSTPGSGDKQQVSPAVAAQIVALVQNFISTVLVQNAVLGKDILVAVQHALGMKEQDLVSAARTTGKLSDSHRSALSNELNHMLIESKNPADRDAIRGVKDIVDHPEKYEPGSFKVEDMKLRFLKGPFTPTVHDSLVTRDLARNFYDLIQQELGSQGSNSRFWYFTWDSPWLAKTRAHATAGSATLKLTDRDVAMMRTALYNLPIERQVRLVEWVKRQRPTNLAAEQFFAWIDVTPAWSDEGYDVEFWHPWTD